MSPNSESQQPSCSSESGSTPPSRVLLVEDNAVNQLVASEMLAHFGCSTEVANNGSEAVEFIKTNLYDLVLMDCQMPVMDGYEATAAIRKWEREMGRDETPIVALTANALSGEKEKCLQAGMNKFMTKPFTMDSFAEILGVKLAPSNSESDARSAE